jgi:hypothetical protein
MSSVTVSKEVGIGEIVIAGLLLLVLIAVSALTYTYRLTQSRASADGIRRSAGIVAAKLAREAELDRRFFEDLQSTLTDVSEKVAETHATQPANRMFYRTLGDAIAKSAQRRLDENREVATTDLFRQVPEFQQTFDGAFQAMRVDEYRMYEELSLAIQSALRDPEVLNLSGSPEVGNVLRGKVADISARFVGRMIRLSRPLWCDATDLITMSDDELLDGERRANILDGHPVPKLAPVPETEQK